MCYRMRRGRTDEQRYAIISPYFDGRLQMNGPYPEITNISLLAKLFFKTFIRLIADSYMYSPSVVQRLFHSDWFRGTRHQLFSHAN
jgi:hypothetical protein